MLEAVSFLIAKWLPFTQMYKGSFSGAICTNSTSAPGIQPISSNFKGIKSKDSSDIYPISPMCKDAIVLKDFCLGSKGTKLEWF